LGANHASSLEAALAYYNYATQLKGKISLLDSNELDTGFRFTTPNHLFSPQPTTVDGWLALPNSVMTLTINSIIPAAGAYSFNVPAVSGTLPDGKVAELKVEGSRPITVSITGSSSQFTGTNTIGTGADLAPHAWFTTTQQTGYVYSANGKAPKLFVTLINPSLTEKVNNVKVTLRIRDASLPEAMITEPQDGAQVSNRVITVAGTIPEAARTTTKNVVVTTNGISANEPMQPDGTFSVQVIIALKSNSIKVQGFGDGAPTTEEKVITVQGVESTSTERNALIASRAVFVLRWNTDASDVDIYSTDKNSGTVWYDHLSEGPGILDYDDRDGLGPEVVSYRATDDELYASGAFAVDVHYYDAHGNPLPANFTLNVVLNENETEGNNRRVLEFHSVTPLTTANSGENGPDGSGASRYNDILRVSCSAERICSLAEVDSSRLTAPGHATDAHVAFEYEGEHGPAHWGELSPAYATCGTGQSQSPINLTGATAQDLANIVFNYQPTQLHLENTGHSIQVNYDAGSYMEVDGERYNLAQFHFHTPSENVVNGASFPIEMHLVHKNQAGKIAAVVAVFLNAGAESAGLQSILTNMPDNKGKKEVDGQINVNELLPAVQTTYRYQGSLTTPPCDEGIKWFVMTAPATLSSAQVTAMNGFHPGNNRPVQPLNERNLSVDSTP
jgi:carbonic anhydrase/uncharacterized protein YfaP (DUF2135 family)